MRSRLPLPLTLIALLLATLPAARGRAQTYTAPLALELSAAAPAVAAPWSLSSATPKQADLSERKAHKQQRRARLLLAVGLGLVIGSSVHLAASIPRRQCGRAPPDEHMRTFSIYTASAVGTVGLGLTIGGGIWRANASNSRPKPSAHQRWLAAGVGLGSAAVATALSMFAWAIDSAGCGT